jgi:hypothetical protein
MYGEAISLKRGNLVNFLWQMLGKLTFSFIKTTCAVLSLSILYWRRDFNDIDNNIWRQKGLGETWIGVQPC